MSKARFFLFTAIFAFALSFILSCSSGGNGNDSSDDGSSSSSSGGNDSSGDGLSSSSGGETSNSIKKASISGVFQKGPFVQGTLATLNELNYDLQPTGRPFQTLITDDKGSFELKNVELASPYAHLIASGFYRNKVTGQISASPITLQAIADVTDKGNINVNVLTHLEYYRVLGLVETGKTIKEAKKQAQKEIFAVFGIDSDSFKDSEDMSIFGASESDAALLAVSVLLLGDLSEGQFSQRLMDFSQAIRESGKWENEEVKNAMADWASEKDLGSVKDNILDWELSAGVPDFGKFIYDFWVGSYGLGNCNVESKNNIKKNVNENSEKNKDALYICKNNSWIKAKRGDIIASMWNCSSSNEGEEKYLDYCLNEREYDDHQPFYKCENGIWKLECNFCTQNLSGYEYINNTLCQIVL